MKFILALCAVALIVGYKLVDAQGNGTQKKGVLTGQRSGSDSPFKPGRLSGFRPTGNYKGKPVNIDRKKGYKPVKLGKYDRSTIKLAQEQFENIDSQVLENGLLKTELFKDMVSQTRKEFGNKLSEKQINDKIRGRVVRKLTRMENTYKKVRAEQLLIRALLDKGFGYQIPPAQAFETILF